MEEEVEEEVEGSMIDVEVSVLEVIEMVSLELEVTETVLLELEVTETVSLELTDVISVLGDTETLPLELEVILSEVTVLELEAVVETIVEDKELKLISGLYLRLS